MGRCKSWALNSGLDHGLDYGLEYGLIFTSFYELLQWCIIYSYGKEGVLVVQPSKFVSVTSNTDELRRPSSHVCLQKSAWP